MGGSFSRKGRGSAVATRGAAHRRGRGGQVGASNNLRKAMKGIEMGGDEIDEGEVAFDTV